MGRNISDVIDRVVAEIPPGHDRLIRELKKIDSSARFTAPEMMSERWRSLGVLLSDELGDPHEEPWKLRISDIVEGRAESAS